MKENKSGTIKIQDNHIYWEFRDKILEEIDVNEIAVIGEFTNTNGPKYDDWFLVFVLKDGGWKNISLYADHADQMTEFLTQKFGHDLNEAHLANSVAWDSVIVHPLMLSGKPLFTIKKEQKPVATNLLNRILNPLGRQKFNQAYTVDLTAEAKAHLIG